MEHSHLLTIATAPKFILAGKAIFTAKSLNTGNRFTYKVVKAKKNTSDKTVYFCSVLTGTDNNSNYSFFGSIIKNEVTGQIHFFWSTKNRNVGSTAPSVVAFDYVINSLIAQNKFSTKLELWHEGRCGRCGRLLTVPESIESGIGPECAKHM